MKILFIDTVHPFLNDALAKDGHHCVAAHEFSLPAIIEQLKDADGIVIRSRILIDKSIIDHAPQLKFIARAGAGMESIDTEYAASKGIACMNSPEGNRNAVGEHSLGMLLSLFNNLNRADQQVRHGKWIREGNRGHELDGKTVGIIGYGNMGSAFASKLKGFECKVLAYDKYKSGFGNEFVKEATLAELFESCDVVSLHVPLTNETNYLVNSQFISHFRKPFWLINTARGKCVSIADLVANLKSGKILGACLDVYEYEDTSFEKFSIESAGLSSNPDWQYLTSAENVILTPHIAGWTFESHRKISEVLYSKIKSAVR